MTKAEIKTLILKHVRVKYFQIIPSILTGVDDLVDELYSNIASEECKQFNVFGHDSDGLPIIISICAKHSADAIKIARAKHPDCKFNHSNLIK